MMFKLKTVLIPTLILAAALPALALEQRDRDEVREQIHSVKIWQMTRDLGLSEKQAREFFPALEDFENRNRQLQESRDMTQQELEMLLDDGQEDSERVQRLLVYLDDLDEQERDIEQRFTRKRDGILTIRQQARYELFERKFKNNLRKMLRDIRAEERMQDGRRDRDSLGTELDRDRRSREREEMKSRRDDSSKRDKSATDRNTGGDEKKATDKEAEKRDDTKTDSGSDDRRGKRDDDDNSTGKKRGR